MDAEKTGRKGEKKGEKKEPEADEAPPTAGPHPWESELADYPLRPPEEDPGWAVSTVKIWLWVALGSGLFILALIVLGFFFD